MSPTTCDKASTPMYAASIGILVSCMSCINLSIFDTANYKSCISLAGVDSSVLLTCVSSANFDMVLISVVWHLSEFLSQDTRYMKDVEKCSDPSENAII